MKVFQFLFLGLVLALTSCGETTANKTAEAKTDAVENTTAETNTVAVADKVELIDFYGTHRCVTCKAIEANAGYTVDTYFADEKKAGKVIFKTVNVDDEANYDMAEIYEATGTALFLNVVKDGKETHIDLTDFAFDKGTEQAEFSAELKAKIQAELATL